MTATTDNCKDCGKPRWWEEGYWACGCSVTADDMEPIYEAALNIWWSAIAEAEDRPEEAAKSLQALAQACGAELDRRHAAGLPIPKHHAVGHRAEAAE